MNISVQLCGLINSVVLLIFYLSARKLRSYKRRIFLLILIINIANISFDIGSIIAIFFRASLSNHFVNTICKIYLCMLDMETWIAIMYITADVFPKDRHKMFGSLFAVIAVIECFLICKYPIHIYADGMDVFTYGTSVNMLYAFGAVNICAIWISSFVFEDRIKKRRVWSVRLWMMMWIAGMAVQAMNHTILVVGFASSLGLMVVYFMIENPEGYLDKQYTCLNSLALEEYVEEAIYNGEKFSLCELILENVAEFKVETDESRKQIAEVIDYFKGFKNVEIYKNFDKNLILTAADSEVMRTAVESYINVFRNRKKEDAESLIIIFERADAHKSLQEIRRIIDYVKERHTDDGYIIKIDEAKIEKYKLRDHIRSEISHALNDDRVEVFLQPIYNTRKKRFTSAEALVRIRNTDGSLLSPGLFIPVAEETGQVNELGSRVLEKVCDFLAGCRNLDLGIEYIEVNLSVVQAEKLTLFDEIIETVQKYDIDPSQINLEITESALIKNKDIIIDNMNQLRRVGFTFALDDFGKGESNLMYLVEMPFDILKLDMDMTKAFHVSDKAKSALRSIRYLADDMKLKIVAEGIENSDEFNAFAEYDIEYIQGYYFSRPLPMSEFIDFVRDFKEKV